MVALEFAMIKAPVVRSVITLSSSGRHQPWQIGISECQRAAVYADPKWQGGMYHQDDPPTTGLSVARMMAMLTYRTHPAYWTKFGRGEKDPVQTGPARPSSAKTFEVEEYLRVQ